MLNYQEKITKTFELVVNSKFLVAFTGAGVSTESGIPDFRSKNGLWSRFRIVTLQEFLFDKEARKEFWRMRKELIGQLIKATPNKAHLCLVELEKMGFLKYIITQNIDRLHQLAGSQRVVELHGNNQEAQCLNCKKKYSIDDIYERLIKNEEDITCYLCKGIIKPKIVFFGEAMPQKEMSFAIEIANKCDLMFVIGSSLQVEPAASIPRIAYHSGAKLIFINKTETEWDFMAEVLFHDSAGKVMTDLLDMIKSSLR
ncbi:MAG: NAD-dependent deacylase [Thermodesulfovibrionaceae bacterium]